MTLTTLPLDPILDQQAGLGQRSISYRFDLIDGITGEVLGNLTPLRQASLSHSTQQTIKRRLTLSLGKADTAEVNPVRDRVAVYMTAQGVDWPLGRYMWTGQNRVVYSSGNLSTSNLIDEMFIVDQPIEHGINGIEKTIQAVIYDTVAGLDVILADLPASDFLCTQSWGIGSTRGAILEALSVTGDYFSPWFGNDTKLHFVRSFDPATAVPQFDYDSGFQVYQQGIIETDDLLTAPNRIIVVSNAASNAGSAPVVGIADIASTAPNSIGNRGFVVAKVFNLQLSNLSQASSVAQGLAQRATIFETVSLTTGPDPRHDSYDVIRWQGENWLELGWTLDMAGGSMSHTLRRSYT
jgi:hypothetical protein